ncbi:hypothetical protein EBH_0010600 [Eimeria brunetti]|uniref:Uncharacterized protein n=1 Tax=Eimeria brunetti TaxID=51314 RepID=U6LBV7_9EIME|nr:hypothetical protein EBH_0010600 [Eimeria brunetti]
MQHGQQQAMWQEEREERYREEKRRRQAKQDLWREEQPLLLQPSYRLSGPSQEDEWIAPDSPKPEAPQPSTSQQAFHFSAPATVADTTTSDGVSTQGGWGFPGGPPATYLAATHAGASWGSAASAVGGRAPLGSSIAPRHRAVANDEHISVNMPALTRLLAHARAAGAPESAGTGAAAAASGSQSSMPEALLNSGMAELLPIPESTVSSSDGHPFARLPALSVMKVPAGISVDMKRAVESGGGMRNPEALLEKAHSLLSRELLYPGHMAELAHVAGMLLAHAMHHQSRDLSKQKLSRAVKQLGIRFLVLDAAVSAFVVLDQEPDAARWKVITNAINHAFPPLPVRPAHTGRPNVNYYRARDLSRAIQMLKTGQRPDSAQLIRLKRMLFCLPSSPAYFKRRVFDGWRLDDRLTK